MDGMSNVNAGCRLRFFSYAVTSRSARDGFLDYRLLGKTEVPEGRNLRSDVRGKCFKTTFLTIRAAIT